MDEEVRDRVRREAEKHALFNAAKHGEDAQVGAVMGPLLGDNPDFRKHADEIGDLVGTIVAEVNHLDPETRRARLEQLAPDLVATLEAEVDSDDDCTLPDLPNVEGYDEIRMRLAPNPNGPWHLGHARMPSVIGTYAAEYDGWFACRFDDTDPETKRPDLAAYDSILEDLDYLGFEADLVVRASDRLETYYEHGRKLIDCGGAYTCSCSQATFSELKNAGEPCEHRGKAEETSLQEFEAMIDGEYKAGDMVLRVRTDMAHENPALRDWVAFRLVDTPHPRGEAADYRCWPLLDFQSGIDDRLLDITHIVRGIDLQDSARRQAFVYDYFGWDYPEVVHWGRIEVDEYGVQLSTTTIRELIERGELDGWDDPRAPTLQSLRRRGIKGRAVVESMVELGTSTSNVDLSMSTIYARNRELVDDGADRLFLVRDGIQKQMIGGPETAEPPVHPDHEDRGRRHIAVGGTVLVEADDLPPNGQRVWLKGFGCVRHTRDAFEYTGDTIEVVREEGVPVIHWVPATNNRTVRLRTMEGDVAGAAELGITECEPDNVVQFERVGFARIDAHEEATTVAYFAHS